MQETTWLKWGVLALAGVVAAVLVVVAFNSSDDLEGRTWVAEEIAIDGALTPLVANTVVTAAFEDGSVSGIAGCNNYFGGYEVDGDAITFGALGSTLMACEPAVMDQEQAYLAALANADRFSVDGSTMTLYSGDTALVEYAEAAID